MKTAGEIVARQALADIIDTLRSASGYADAGYQSCVNHARSIARVALDTCEVLEQIVPSPPVSAA